MDCPHTLHSPGISEPASFMAVDLGNSRLKATWLSYDSDGNRLADVRVMSPETPELLLDWVEEIKQTTNLKGAFASVGQADARLIESIRREFGDGFLVITSQTSLPVGIEYATPHTLGVDRKATACAAAAGYPGEGVAVVDSGSALTIDIVSADGRFIGGNISPGLGMRLKSLNQFTAKLPLFSSEEAVSSEIPEWGNDTRSAMITGCLRGLLDEVAMEVVRAEGIVGRVVLTGGGGKYLAENLPEVLRMLGKDNIKIDYEPHLLAEGMREIYIHHENEI